MNARTESVLTAMTGRRLPGGCDDCDAYQVLSQLPSDTWGSLFVLTVHHDDTCPQLNGATEWPPASSF